MMAGARGEAMTPATETATVQTAARDGAATAAAAVSPRASARMTGTVAGARATGLSAAETLRVPIVQARPAPAAPSQPIRAAAMAGGGLTCRAAREAAPQS